MAELPDGAGGSGGCLRSHRSADVHAVIPVASLGNQGQGESSPSAEQDGAQGDALRVFPVRGKGRILAGRGGESRVGMRGGRARVGRPGVALPISKILRRGAIHAFPPDATVIGHGNVGKDGVGLDCLHRIGVGLVAGAGCNAEVSALGIDRPQSAVRADVEPADVIPYGPHRPALLLKGRFQHGQVGLAASAREGARDVHRVAVGCAQLEDEHVLG